MKDRQNLDNLIDEIVKLSSPNEDEVKAIAESPFLFRRLKVSIGEENRKEKSIVVYWREMFSSFKFAATVMAAIALFVICTAVLMLSPARHETTAVSNKPTQISASAVDETTGMANEDLFADTMGFPNAAKEVKEVK